MVSAARSPASAAKAVDGVVNLNTAPPDILALLPGIGPAKAAAVVVYRTRRPFRTVDELVRIKGIGRKLVRRLRPHLAIGGPTTALPSRGEALARGQPAPTASKPVSAPIHPLHALRCPGIPPRARPPRALRPLHSPCLGPP
jgi:competence protein ComEA